MSTSTPSTPTLTADILAAELAAGRPLDELIPEFAADAELLERLASSDRFQNHLKLRATLAVAQARLLAAEALPAALGKLLHLMDAEKPETARRAIMSVLGMNGIATKVSPIKQNAPQETPPENHPKEDAQTDKQADPPSRPSIFQPRPHEDLIKKHETEILDLHQTLYFRRGIDLLQVLKANFNGFADYLQAFFKPAGIIFNRDDGTENPYQWETSIHNPKAVAQAKDFLAELHPDADPAASPALLQPFVPDAITNQNPNDSAHFASPEPTENEPERLSEPAASNTRQLPAPST